MQPMMNIHISRARIVLLLIDFRMAHEVFDVVAIIIFTASAIFLWLSNDAHIALHSTAQRTRVHICAGIKHNSLVEILQLFLYD